MAKTNLKFRRNETFYIRSGWLEKAILAIGREQKNIFYKNDGVEILGIGANMVTGLKYWLSAANVIDTDKSNGFTEFGNCLFEYDRFMESRFSWLLVHYFLVRNRADAPIFYEVFNSDLRSFTKNDLYQYLMYQFDLKGEKINPKYLESDLNVFIKTYVNEDTKVNPENNYVCPLSSLKLLKKEKNTYRRVKPKYSEEDNLVVFYMLQEMYGTTSFNIEDSMNAENSPLKVFNLDKYGYLKCLDDLKKEGLIYVTKTAGLNVVDFVSQQRITLSELFEKRFK